MAKKSPQLTWFDSLDAIAASFFEEATAKDDKLLVWSRIAKLPKILKKIKKAESTVKVQDVGLDGQISVDELKTREFVVGAVVKSKLKAEASHYKIIKITPENILVQKTDADGEPIHAKKPACNNENISSRDFIVKFVAFEVLKKKVPHEHTESLRASRNPTSTGQGCSLG